jgi:PAS fold
MQSDTKFWTDDLATELEQSEDCVKLVSLDGRVQWMNANGLCTMEIDEFGQIENRQWTDLWPEETRHTIRSGIVKAATGQAVHIDAFCPTMKGKLLRWDVSISQVKDMGGNPIGYLAISRDITNG